MSTTYGFIGSGDSPVKNVKALIKDLVGGDTDAKFIIPVSQTTWTPTISTIADFAMDNDLALEVVTDDTAESNKDFATIISSAEKVHRVTKVPMKIVNLLEKNPDNSALIVAWDDEDADSLKALERALLKQVPASDLTNALEPLSFEDDEDEDVDPQAIFDTIGNAQPEVEDEPEDPRPHSRRVADKITAENKAREEEDVDFVEDDEGFASPIDAETDEFEADDTEGLEDSSQIESESFDNDENEAESSYTADDQSDETSSEDEMTTATQARQVAHPYSPAATASDFESTYSLDVSPDEILAQAMDIMCDRIAARVLAVVMPAVTGQQTARPAAPKQATQVKTTPTAAKAPAAKQKAPAPKAAAKTSTEATIDLSDLRLWARENGFEVGERGRIKQEIKDAYMNRDK